MKVHIVPIRPLAIDILAPAASASLSDLGINLRIARERRGDSLRAMAARIGTSIPTLRRMEAGDPTVAMGIYAAALWVFGKSGSLPEIMHPGADEFATRLDVERASRKRV